jgi:hypothetical protein
MRGARATHDFEPGGVESAIEFLKRTSAELRPLTRVRIGTNWLQVIDVNKDYFEVRGIGYADADIVPLLRYLNAVYDPTTLHEPIAAEYKEYGAGRRYPWSADRVM